MPCEVIPTNILTTGRRGVNGDKDRLLDSIDVIIVGWAYVRY